MPRVSPPRGPLALVLRHRDRQHLSHLLYSYTIIWGSYRRAQPSDRWRSPSLDRTATSVAWTGCEEANDWNYFYMMDRTGSEVKGQA